jgi:hypothetical protein
MGGLLLSDHVPICLRTMSRSSSDAGEINVLAGSLFRVCACLTQWRVTSVSRLRLG